MLAFQPPQAANRRTSGSAAHRTRNIASDDTASKAAPTPPVATALPQSAADKPKWQDPDWSALINQLNLTGANKLLASNCAYLNRENGTLYFNLDSRSQSLLTKSREKALADAVSECFGEPLRVQIGIAESAPETPMQREARHADERIEAARASLEADPNVKALQDMFGAQLNPDSIELVHRPSGDGSDAQPTSTE
jgi:DNA polymerase-3 subunit gamma/tau